MGHWKWNTGPYKKFQNFQGHTMNNWVSQRHTNKFLRTKRRYQPIQTGATNTNRCMSLVTSGAVRRLGQACFCHWPARIEPTGPNKSPERYVENGGHFFAHGIRITKATSKACTMQNWRKLDFTMSDYHSYQGDRHYNGKWPLPLVSGG